MESGIFHKGMVEFVSLPGYVSGELRELLAIPHASETLEAFIQRHGRAFECRNMIFNFPRIQYAALDRGETPETVNASWFTLTNTALTNPAQLTVPGEASRLPPSTKTVDPSSPKNSLFRFILDVGQFVGSWKTAVLIGGADATSAVGTGKIIAAVNDVRDDSNAPLNRDGTTVHLVNWKLKQLDSSEV